MERDLRLFSDLISDRSADNKHSIFYGFPRKRITRFNDILEEFYGS